MTYGGVEVSLHRLLTLALGVDGHPRVLPFLFQLKRHRYTLKSRLAWTFLTLTGIWFLAPLVGD
jgi:hypothetical protein